MSRPFREPPLHGSNRKTGTGPANSSAGASPATRARLVSWPRTLGRRHSGLAPSRQGLTSSASPTSNPPGAPSMSSTRTLPPGRGQDRRALGHPRRPSPCMTSSSAAQPHETRTTYPSTSRGTPHTLPRAVRFIWNGWDGVEHDHQARGNRAEPREDPGCSDVSQEPRAVPSRRRGRASSSRPGHGQRRRTRCARRGGGTRPAAGVYPRVLQTSSRTGQGGGWRPPVCRAAPASCGLLIGRYPP